MGLAEENEKRPLDDVNHSGHIVNENVLFSPRSNRRGRCPQPPLNGHQSSAVVVSMARDHICIILSHTRQSCLAGVEERGRTDCFENWSPFEDVVTQLKHIAVVLLYSETIIIQVTCFSDHSKDLIHRQTGPQFPCP